MEAGACLYKLTCDILIDERERHGFLFNSMSMSFTALLSHYYQAKLISIDL